MQVSHEVKKIKLIKFALSVKELLNLRADTDEVSTLKTIRENVDFKSANAWTLIFAIFIASVGLNVNSAAVVIGAMLISPLMGPIVGLGLALGINDYPLLRRSLVNLLMASGLSITASTIYFALSPLSEVQSELLARTTPTFFDVLIATFGGAVGIIALSRRSKGNALPGAAIATALMPPLCTAGFGLANGQWQYFLGALYLFTINCVFICISTYIVVRYLKFSKVENSDAIEQKKRDRFLGALAAFMIIPSLILAWFLQRESTFTSRAKTFINHEIKFDQTFVVDQAINYSFKKPQITISLVGEELTPQQIEILKIKLKSYQLPTDALIIRQTSFADQLEKRLSDKFNSQTQVISDAELNLSKAQAQVKLLRDARDLETKVSKELMVLFPRVAGAHFTLITQDLGGKDVLPRDYIQSILITWKENPTKTDYKKAAAFLKQRVDGPSIEISSAKLLQ
jgi:uncharacterized hydrophobic protein (TIGR00271 family)